ncbi:MAG TPA: hypothetical protein VJX67_08080 [Blastocatellia bacterium]|nr:hypothetical protein [Blastocatellia bacterium]
MNSHSRADAIRAQIKRFEQRGTVLDGISRRYWWARRGIFFGGAAGSVAVFELAGKDPGWITAAAFIVIFATVVHFHGKVLSSIDRNKIWIRMKLTQIGRIELDWSRIPSAPSLGTVPGHPFETDLDLTGDRSLHCLLDTALTNEGSIRLRDWLLDLSPRKTLIDDRQELVKELAHLRLFRDKLLLCSEVASKEAGKRWQAAAFLDWLRRRGDSRSLLPVLTVLSILAGVDLVLFTLFLVKILPAYWLITLLVYAGIIYARGDDIAMSFSDAMVLEESLKGLLAVFRHLEKYRHKNSPRLRQLAAPFLDPENRPSKLLKRVARIASALSLRAGNPYLWAPVILTVPWDFFFGHLLNRSKSEIARLMPVWLDAWFELEALISLANFSALNPDYVFPALYPDPAPDLAQTEGQDVVETGMVFRAKGLGHPLLPRDRKVTNDFILDDGTRVAILTGSNMAGKSTFLRTLGVNLSLAYAGGPVDAREFESSLFRIFTCIKVSDSVTDGLSYFYAEVKRLRALLSSVETDSAHPHFVLIDEIFRGTNNRERRIGSQSYIKKLAGLHVIGAVATHDLELVRLADDVVGITNFHFREEVHGGQMVFDYRLRPGPCPTTNALKIMRMEGLPVDIAEEPAAD